MSFGVEYLFNSCKKIGAMIRITLLAHFTQLAAATTFYTILPLPQTWGLEFDKVARWVVIVGLLIGNLLSLVDLGLASLGMPILTRSAVLVFSWVWLTGGLHVDGVIDTADGLAVQNLQRRLLVMADSAAGAFGVMAAIALLALKVTALTDLPHHRWLVVSLAAGWGRWGQQWAIVHYPYLKTEGKGAFHKAALSTWPQLLPGLALLLGLALVPWLFQGHWLLTLGLLSGGAIAPLVAAWFNRQLGGYTGDVYGAVVEWTEAIFLVTLTLFVK
jgi:adenosylcobinamide-GDP ribazoletransferase